MLLCPATSLYRFVVPPRNGHSFGLYWQHETCATATAAPPVRRLALSAFFQHLLCSSAVCPDHTSIVRLAFIRLLRLSAEQSHTGCCLRSGWGLRALLWCWWRVLLYQRSLCLNTLFSLGFPDFVRAWLASAFSGLVFDNQRQTCSNDA